MAKKPRLTPNERNLMRRYLVWCYKTTKEELDKVDRYFTQLIVDDFVLKQLKKAKEYKGSGDEKSFQGQVGRFQAYMKEKEINVMKKKFQDRQHNELNADYLYLKNRFTAIEKAIQRYLGAGELGNICRLYEEEMTGRILKAREHT